MSTDPQSPEADPTDVAEQQQELVPPVEDEEAPTIEPGDVPTEADEADVADQRTEVPGLLAEDEDEES